MPITLLVLLLVFGSAIAAGLPLLVGAGAVAGTLAVLGLLAEATTMSTYALNLTTALGLLGSLLVTLVEATIVLAATGAGLGLAYAMVESDPATGIRLLGYQLLYLPAVLAVAGVAVLLHGCAPRLAKTAWVFFALCFVLSWLGALLDPPGWLLAVSPFEHAAFVPVENADPWATSLTAVVTVLAVGIGVLGLRRRDIR